MRKTTVLIALFATATTAGLALASPQGMAPYPGQTAGPPPPPPPPGASTPYQAPQPGAVPAKRPTCVWTRRITGWTPVDDYQMIVTQGTKRYLVTFSGRCMAQRREDAMQVSRHNGSCLSPGDTVEFGAPFGYGPRGIYGSCMISKIEMAPARTAQR